MKTYYVPVPVAEEYKPAIDEIPRYNVEGKLIEVLRPVSVSVVLPDEDEIRNLSNNHRIHGQDDKTWLASQHAHSVSYYQGFKKCLELTVPHLAALQERVKGLEAQNERLKKGKDEKKKPSGPEVERCGKCSGIINPRGWCNCKTT